MRWRAGDGEQAVAVDHDDAVGNVAAGAVVLDAATLAGGYQPTGIVTFALYGPDDPTCEHAPAAVRTGSVVDGSASSGGVPVTQAGTYHWVATYGGDDNNAGARSSCRNEPVTAGPGSLAPLALAPASVTVHVGSGQAYTATGYDAYGNLIGDVTGQTTFTIAGGGSCHANSCTGPVGPHTVTGTAQSASGTARLFISAVNQAPAIATPASATFRAGRAGRFTITATGLPTPSLIASGRLPAGIRFHDHGNGTATLSGTPAAGTAGAYRLTITARNRVSPDAIQRFVLIVRARARPGDGPSQPPARDPLRHGCVTETATNEHEITAVIADAICRHFLLTVQGTIECSGKVIATATGAVSVKVRVKLPRGSAAPSAQRPAPSAQRRVSHGRWRISLVLPGVNLDPVPPHLPDHCPLRRRQHRPTSHNHAPHPDRERTRRPQLKPACPLRASPSAAVSQLAISPGCPELMLMPSTARNLRASRVNACCPVVASVDRVRPDRSPPLQAVTRERPRRLEPARAHRHAQGRAGNHGRSQCAKRSRPDCRRQASAPPRSRL